MKKILAVFLLLLLPILVFADYNSSFAAGKEAFAAKDYTKALENFKAAYAEKATKEAKSYIDYLEKRTPAKQQPKSGSNFNAVILLGTDVILTALAVNSLMDYNADKDAYNTLYSAVNNTSEYYYNDLLYKKKLVEQKGTAFMIMSSVAGLAIAYTLADLFVFHNAFEAPVQVGFNPATQYAGLSKAWRF